MQLCIPVGCVPPARNCVEAGGIFLERDPPGQRPPGQRLPLDRDPSGQRCPLDRDFLDRDPPLDRDPLGQRPPWTKTPNHVNRIIDRCINIIIIFIYLFTSLDTPLHLFLLFLMKQFCQEISTTHDRLPDLSS